MLDCWPGLLCPGPCPCSLGPFPSSVSDHAGRVSMERGCEPPLDAAAQLRGGQAMLARYTHQSEDALGIRSCQEHCLPRDHSDPVLNFLLGTQ